MWRRKCWHSLFLLIFVTNQVIFCTVMIANFITVNYVNVFIESFVLNVRDLCLLPVEPTALRFHLEVQCFCPVEATDRTVPGGNTLHDQFLSLGRIVFLWQKKRRKICSETQNSPDGTSEIASLVSTSDSRHSSQTKILSIVPSGNGNIQINLYVQCAAQQPKTWFCFFQTGEILLSLWAAS